MKNSFRRFCAHYNKTYNPGLLLREVVAVLVVICLVLTGLVIFTERGKAESTPVMQDRLTVLYPSGGYVYCIISGHFDAELSEDQLSFQISTADGKTFPIDLTGKAHPDMGIPLQYFYERVEEDNERLPNELTVVYYDIAAWSIYEEVA